MYFSSGIPTKIYNWSQHRDHHGTGSDVQRARVGSDVVNSVREPYSKKISLLSLTIMGSQQIRFVIQVKINYIFRCPRLK